VIVSLCPELLFNRRQPIAGFIDHDHEPCYYCAKCLCARIEDALREGMPPTEIVDTINFERCGHVEDGTGTCGRCAKAIMAMLTYLSMTLHLKPGHDPKQLRRLNEIIARLVKQHGRITPDGIFTRYHGKAL